MGVRVLLLVVVAVGVVAQERTSTPIQVQGNLNVTAEAYTSSGDGAEPRFLPRYGMRVFFRPVVRLFGQMELPFELSLGANTGTRASYPLAFQQPFNQLGASPQITSWLRLHGGYFSLQLSELTFGDLRVLGGGMELSPGVLRLKSFYGIVQHSRPVDTTVGFPGVYRRRAWGGSVGIATEGGTEILLHYVRLLDDTASIRLLRVLRDSLRTDTVVTPAQDNAIAALSFRAPIAKSVVLQGEVAFSAYSSTLRAPEKDVGIPRWLFVSRYSSNLDGAAVLSATVAPSPAFSLTLKGRWIGPGFSSLGYAQLNNDIAEGVVAPSFSFAKNTVSVRLSLGAQWNNLRNTRLGTTRRLIGSTSVGWQPSPSFGVDVQYANYGMRMQHQNDTLRVQNVSHSISLNPRWQFSGLGGTNLLMFSYSFSQTSDRNPITGAATQNRNHTGLVSHTLQFPSTVGLTTMANYTVTEVGGVWTRLWMAGETVSYSFLPGRLTGSVGLTLSQVIAELQRTRATLRDTQLGVRLTLTYSLTRWGTLSWNAFVNRSERAGRRPFTELHTSLNYGLSF